MELAQATERARAMAEGLYPHQVEGVGFLLGRRRAILADDMGLGKTRQSIIAMTEAAPLGPYLVVCPASVKHNWVREILMARPGASTHIVGPDLPPPVGFSGWVIVNYDLLKRHIDALQAHSFAGFVFDEAHYLKNHRAQRSQLSRRLVSGSDPFIHLLTGTPLTNRPRDLFPLLQLVGHSLGRSFLAFAKRYCDGHKNEYGYWMTGGSSNIEELSLQLQGTMMRRNKDEVLDLPAKQRTWIEIDVDEKTRTRLNEVVSSFLNEEARTDRGWRRDLGLFSSARRQLAIAKVPQTLEYVQGVVEQGEKVILYSCFTRPTQLFADHFGDQAVVVTGKVPTPRRQALVDRFQEDGSVRVFIGQIHAAGVGINLTAARIVVFNDLDWVPANHWQAEDRAHRIGQNRTVSVTYMIARGTLEEFVRTVLEAKSQLIDDLVEGTAMADQTDTDVLTELKRLVVHLGSALETARRSDHSPESIEALLRAASESYLAEHARHMNPTARRKMKPISETAIKALAGVLAGPGRAVYVTASSSSPDTTHRLEVEGGDITCDCKGFSYRGMCRHVRELKQSIASGEQIPVQFRRVD